jgi:PAS domain S-box-containing protein
MGENSKNSKVLVVDDEPAQLFAMARILRSAGYDVLEASTGKEALEKARHEDPDLVLLDVILPDIGGVEVAKEIKRDSRLNSMVILISGSKISSEAQSKGLEEGADGYLTKPIPKRELLARVESILRIKNSEEVMLKSEEKYRLIVENAREGIWSIDAEANTIFVNQYMANMLGYTVDEMLGMHLFSFMDEDNIEIAKNNLENRKKGIQEHYDFEFIRKDGERIYTSISASPINDQQGKYVGALALVADVTERRKMEQKIQKSLKEKEMLLKEIHHRVKNNLMIIASLLNIQSRYIKDTESQEIFKESQNRARSMAIIHERLYQSVDLKRIDFGDYVRTLSNELFHAYADDSGRIKLKINLDAIFVDINIAIPLGLIINELITNSLKHAFPKGRGGEITLDFHKKEDSFELTVKDNGIGFPEDLDYRSTSSLGLQLVNSLTEQIDGKVEMDGSNGTCFKITFQN